MEKVKGIGRRNVSHPLSRLIRLYRKFEQQPYLTLQMIMEDFNIDDRTARRDVATLMDAGVPLYDEFTSERVKLWRLLKRNGTD